MSHESTRPVVMDETQRTNTPQHRSSLLLAVAIVLDIVLLTTILTSRISFRRLLEDFGIAPSPITSFALGGFLPALLALVLFATVAIAYIRVSPKLKNSWNAIAVGVTLACLVVYMVGIVTPLVRLIESLS